jgi:sortase A
MTATMPGVEVRSDDVVADAVAASQPTRRLQPVRRPPRQRPPVTGPMSLVQSAGTMLAIVCLWVVAQMLLFSGFAQEREQTLLYDQFRTEIASALAPIGPGSEPGAPVALLEIPRIGVSQVVVEGTSSGDTLAGPGHLRKTVLPGQVGTSVVMGRAATYGAPFADIDRLVAGDEIVVTMAQGEVTFEVVTVRRAGDPYSQPLQPGAARLTLVSAEGSGRMAALTPGSALYVDADAPEGFVPTPGLPPAVPEAELVMERDLAAFPLLVLHLALLLAVTLGVVVARSRWSLTAVWVVAAPVVLALAWATTDVVMRLLPNVI